MSTGTTIVLIIVLLAVALVAGWFVWNWLRSRKLRDRFGPEYDRRVREKGDRKAAERELTELRRRHDRLQLRPLPDDARARYGEQWALVQEQFVDRPGEALAEAESLVHGVMRERGYPMDGFDQQAADMSVEHAGAVDHYRDGHDIRVRSELVEVSTEDLRKALVHYRETFAAIAGFRSDVDLGRRHDDAAR